MFFPKRTQALLGVFGAAAVLTLGVGIWAVSSGKLSSFANYPHVDLSGKVTSSYSSICNADKVKVTLSKKDSLGILRNIASTTSYWVPVWIGHSYYKYRMHPTSGTTITTGAYTIVGQKTCGSSFTSKWGRYVGSGGECTSGYQQFSISTSDIATKDVALNKVFTNVVVKVSQWICNGPGSDATCLRPAPQAKVYSSYNSTAQITDYNGTAVFLLPSGTYTFTAIKTGFTKGYSESVSVGSSCRVTDLTNSILIKKIF